MISLLNGLVFLSIETILPKILNLSIGGGLLVYLGSISGFLTGSISGFVFNKLFRFNKINELILSVVYFFIFYNFEGFKVSNREVFLEINVVTGNTNVSLLLFSFVYCYFFSSLTSSTFTSIIKDSSASANYLKWSIGCLVGLLLSEIIYIAFGLKETFLIFSFSHLIILLILFFNKKDRTQIAEKTILDKDLVIIGLASGLVQSLLLFLNRLLLGPSGINDSFFIFVIITGSTVGSIISYRYKLKPQKSFEMMYLSVIFCSIYYWLLINFTSIGFFDYDLSLLLAIFPLATYSVSFGTLINSYANKYSENLSNKYVSNVLGLSLGITILPFITNILSPGFLFVGISLILLFYSRKYIWTLVFMVTCIDLNYENIVKNSFTKSKGDIKRDNQVLYLDISGFDVTAIQDFGEHKRLYQTGYSPIAIDSMGGSEFLSGLVASSFNERKKRALVIGSGSGLSVAQVAPYYKKIDIVDISSSTKKLQKELNGITKISEFKDRINTYIMDASLYVTTTDLKYDMIFLTTDPSTVRTATNLYSVEFFQKIKKILNKDGVFVFWLDNQTSPINIQMIMNTALGLWKNNQNIRMFPPETELMHGNFLIYMTSAFSDKELKLECLKDHIKNETIKSRYENICKSEIFRESFVNTGKIISENNPPWDLSVLTEHYGDYLWSIKDVIDSIYSERQ